MVPPLAEAEAEAAGRPATAVAAVRWLMHRGLTSAVVGRRLVDATAVVGRRLVATAELAAVDGGLVVVATLAVGWRFAVAVVARSAAFSARRSTTAHSSPFKRSRMAGRGVATTGHGNHGHGNQGPR